VRALAEIEKRRAFARWWGSFDWISAPPVFSIEDEDNRARVVRFFMELRSLSLEGPMTERHGRKKPRIRIDFSATRWMTAPGTLLFAAELQRIQVVAKRPLTCTCAPDMVVAQVLAHIGIFRLLGHNQKYDITADNVKYWAVDSGAEAKGEQASQAVERYRHLFDDPKQMLYRGLTEAMANCREHAYADERGDGLGNVLCNWWMFSQYKDGRLTIALADLGIGIPRSLPRNKEGLFAAMIAAIRQRGEPEEDVYLIKAAIEEGQTRTEQAHRGKGLMDMRSVLDDVKGTMHIHSNRGSYKYEAGTRTETCTNFGPKLSIRGTIVVWEIPIPEPAATRQRVRSA